MTAIHSANSLPTKAKAILNVRTIQYDLVQKNSLKSLPDIPKFEQTSEFILE